MMTMGQIDQIGAAADQGLLDSSRVRGRIFVLTGVFSMTPVEMKALVITLGGTVQEVVTTNTDHVIMGALVAADSKLLAAANLGIDTMTEEDFVLMITPGETK